eukprot:c9204_g1_i1 orf=76-273(-)
MAKICKQPEKIIRVCDPYLLRALHIFPLSRSQSCVIDLSGYIDRLWLECAFPSSNIYIPPSLRIS